MDLGGSTAGKFVVFVFLPVRKYSSSSGVFTLLLFQLSARQPHDRSLIVRREGGADEGVGGRRQRVELISFSLFRGAFLGAGNKRGGREAGGIASPSQIRRSHVGTISPEKKVAVELS